ncbi:MAG: alpha-1,3-rhamnosyltransferase [Candidatus Peregrinibacteria bacterium Greene0416_19]|nr:MAG: alpha-1,3-rhamnosyltransferase [Candidatus Peregrinibacteria bacterium Greene0416_19]
MSHTLVIDVREACRERRTGKGQWTYGFVSELIRRGQPLHLLSNSPLPSEWEERAHVRPMVTPVRGSRWHLSMAHNLRRMKDILYVSPTSYIVPSLAGKSMKSVVIVHDLIAFQNEPHDRRARWIERLTLGWSLRSATHICSISEATKKDLLDRFPSFPLILAYRSLPSPLRDRFRLLLGGGRGWKDETIIRLARETPGVEWRDSIPDEEYERLLSTCTVFALPSLYEGFGMQILDALQRGIPVLTSDRGSLKEVAGDAAMFVDPESVPAIAEGLQVLLTNADFRRKLTLNGPCQAGRFSWDRTVDLFLDQVLGSRGRSG